jgi:crossover junction endodeoxyribonuclease RuvC
MNIIGIDPGFEKTGYAIFEKNPRLDCGYRYITSGMIKTSRTLTHTKRVSHIGQELSHIFKQHKVKEGAMEQLFFFKNAKTVIGVSG